MKRNFYILKWFSGAAFSDLTGSLHGKYSLPHNYLQIKLFSKALINHCKLLCIDYLFIFQSSLCVAHLRSGLADADFIHMTCVPFLLNRPHCESRIFISYSKISQALWRSSFLSGAFFRLRNRPFQKLYVAKEKETDRRIVSSVAFEVIDTS